MSFFLVEVNESWKIYLLEAIPYSVLTKD